MTIRPARQSDIRSLAEIWALAFPGERTVEQRVRQMEAGGVYGGIETAWIAVDDTDLPIGAFRPYALSQHFHGTTLPMMGLAAVAVNASARRRGLGAELCRIALHHAYERGDVLSVLYPFRPSFYDALGWGLTGSLHRYRFRPESLSMTHESPRVTIIADATTAIASCYEAVALRSNGLIARTPRIWRQHLDWPDIHVAAVVVDGECRAYCIAHFDTQPDLEDSVLTIREMLAVDDDAYTEMLSWISLQRCEWGYVVHDAAPSEHFDLRLTEPRTPGSGAARTLFAHTAAVIRGPMSRIVNVEKALTDRVWPDADCSFGLCVTDDILPGNNSTFGVRIDSTRATVTRSTDQDADGLSLRVDVRTFTQIYLGEISVTGVVSLGRAEVLGASEPGDVKRLDALFRTEPPFLLLDEF